jgi:4-coumarate--CoA ligase
MLHFHGITFLTFLYTSLLCQPLTDGVPVITHAKFDPEQFLASIEKYKATWALVVPPILVVLANSPIVDKYDLTSMKGMLSGAAPLGEGLIRKVMKRLGHGFQVTQGYGESAPGVFLKAR